MSLSALGGSQSAAWSTLNKGCCCPFVASNTHTHTSTGFIDQWLPPRSACRSLQSDCSYHGDRQPATGQTKGEAMETIRKQTEKYDSDKNFTRWWRRHNFRVDSERLAAPAGEHVSDTSVCQAHAVVKVHLAKPAKDTSFSSR